MYQLDISPMVLDDMQEIKTYITNELGNPQAAIDLIKLFTEKIRNLVDFPYSGSSINNIMDIKTDYRFIVCKNYLIFYRVEKLNILVLRILYQKRDYLKILFGDL